MRVTRLDNHISLRPDNDEDRAILKEMADTGIVVFGRGSYLSFYSGKHSDSVNPPEDDSFTFKDHVGMLVYPIYNWLAHNNAPEWVLDMFLPILTDEE